MVELIVKKISQSFSESLPEWSLNSEELSQNIELILLFSEREEDAFSKFISWQKAYQEAIGVPFDHFETLCHFIYERAGDELTHKTHFEKFFSGSLTISDPDHSGGDIASSIAHFHLSLFDQLDAYSKGEYKDRIIKDTQQHVEFLHQAMYADSKVLFTEYITWFESTLNAQGVETLTIIRFLATMRLFFKHQDDTALSFIDLSMNRLKDNTSKESQEIDTFLSTKEARNYLDLLLKGDRKGATDFIMQLVDDGFSLKELYINVFQSSQYEMGLLWEKNKVSVAQEHYCTATTQMIMSMLYPRLFTSKSINKSVVASCVGSELHEIGIRMISDFMEMEGWDTYYLGANTPTEAVIEAISKYDADLLALSVTLTPHIKNAKEIIREVKLAHPDLKVIVGGYPFLQDETLWVKIGADGLAKSANEVNETALALVNG